MTNTEKLFEQVVDILHGRGKSYGHPFPSHRRIAELWSAYLGYPIQPNEAAMCMVLVKISRQAEDPKLMDNYVDALGYLAIAKTITEAMLDEDWEWDDGI